MVIFAFRREETTILNLSFCEKHSISRRKPGNVTIRFSSPRNEFIRLLIALNYINPIDLQYKIALHSVSGYNRTGKVCRDLPAAEIKSHNQIRVGIRGK